MSAFYFGDILQAIRTALEQASLRNCFVILSLDMILKRDSPLTTVPDWRSPSELI
jgi:hypothetical protein